MEQISINKYQVSLQPSNVLRAYIYYVDGKADINELPLSFDQWAELEVLDNSPISASIVSYTF